MKHFLAFLLLAVPITFPNQLQFKADGTGSVTRKVSAKLGEIVSIGDKGAPCDGVNDDVTAIGNAIATLPSTGGTVDARACASMTIGSTLTLSKAGTTLLLPVGTISMGANQIVVPVGVHNVAIVGAAPYGGSAASQTASSGTFLTYTGTTVAILVGDSTGDTYGFTLKDVTVGLTTAGTAAIGIQLNRAIQYTLERPRVHGFTTANTQIAIDLEGFVNFTGGRIQDAYLWNGNIGVYYGKNANSNIWIGGIVLINPSGGTAFRVIGDVAGNADGNTWFGGDVENCTNVFYFDFGFRNQGFGTRNEGNTNLVTATANSAKNTIFNAGSTSTVIDSGSLNSFMTTVNYQLTQGQWTLANITDTQSALTLRAGTSASQSIFFEFKDFDGSRKWYFLKDASNNLILRDGSNFNRMLFTSGSGNLQLNTAAGGGTVQINSQTNAGTGGVNFYSGGASPALVAQIDSAGSYTTTSTKTKGTCTLNAASPAVCTATVVSGATCIATSQGTTAAAAIPLAVSVTTTTLTVTAANGATNTVNYICLG